MAVCGILCHNVAMDNRPMSSMNVSLPESMRHWVESIVAGEGFGTVSEYVRSLIREDQKKRAREELDSKLIQALDSGSEVELTADDWSDIRSKVREKLIKKGA
jgi:antitoxin ParD1/3/4